MRDLFDGTKRDRITRRCVLCGEPYTVHRDPSKSEPHRCPDDVQETYDEADRLADILDDPEGPDIEELGLTQDDLDRFAAHGLILVES